MGASAATQWTNGARPHRAPDRLGRSIGAFGADSASRMPRSCSRKAWRQPRVGRTRPQRTGPRSAGRTSASWIGPAPASDREAGSGNAAAPGGARRPGCPRVVGHGCRQRGCVRSAEMLTCPRHVRCESIANFRISRDGARAEARSAGLAVQRFVGLRAGLPDPRPQAPETAVQEELHMGGCPGSPLSDEALALAKSLAARRGGSVGRGWSGPRRL